MRMSGKLIFSIVVLILLCSVSTYAADQTPNVVGAASSLTAAPNTLQIYPSDVISTENPRDKLCRVVVTFRNIQNKPVYQEEGDTVNFFIKSSRDAELGWIDINANGSFDNGEQLNNTAMGTNDGLHITGAKLSSSSTVTFFIGSRIPGSFTVKVYTDSGSKPGILIGQNLSAVELGEPEVTLSGYNEQGISNLNSDSGILSKPFTIKAGEEIELQVSVKSGSKALQGKTVIFKRSAGLNAYQEIGSSITNENGLAEFRHIINEIGLYSYQAVVDIEESEDLYVKYDAGRAETVEAGAGNKKILALDETYNIEFVIKDLYGNPVDSQGQDIVDFEIIGSPDDSNYKSYISQGKSNSDGIASFTFIPDKPGIYSIRCRLLNRRSSNTHIIEAVKFVKTNAMNFTLKSGDIEIPAAIYNINSSGTVLPSGKLEVKLVNAVGAEIIAQGSTLSSLLFSSADTGVVVIDEYGVISVVNKDYFGDVKLTILDKVSNTAENYTLKIVGPPVSLETEIYSANKKAQVIIKYVDKNGNNTYSRKGEEYYVILPSGIYLGEIKPFDNMGQAAFHLSGDELKVYDIKVITKEKNISKDFQVEFKQVPNILYGAKTVIMYIGKNNYVQDSNTKTTDVAPFIKDGRTFVAVRPIADAFGAAVGWNEAAQTVTLTRSDMTVTIIIGSSTITVVKDGVTKTVNVDVAAFIKDGRTVLPFRAVGDAFGAAVNYDAASQAVGYTQ